MKDQPMISDSHLVKAMENGDLDPGKFNHMAHLQWGWLLLEMHGLEMAIEKACAQLKKYTRLLGVQDKYNETVTIAAIRAIHHFRMRSEAGNFVEFIREFPRLKTSFKELMEFHYSIDIFGLDCARDHYIEPDLLPFD